MADHNLTDTSRISGSVKAAVGSSNTSTSGSATRFLSSGASAMARFSLDLRDIEAADVLNTLSEVPETQLLSTQAIMQELSTDSEVTFRRELGSAEILPTRPGIDPLEDTRPMPDLSRISQSPITASPSVITRQPSRTSPGSVPLLSYIFGPRPELFGPRPEVWSTPHHATIDRISLHYIFGSPGGTPGAIVTEMRDKVSGINLCAKFQRHPFSSFGRDASQIQLQPSDVTRREQLFLLSYSTRISVT